MSSEMPGAGLLPQPPPPLTHTVRHLANFFVQLIRDEALGCFFQLLDSGLFPHPQCSTSQLTGNLLGCRFGQTSHGCPSNASRGGSSQRPSGRFTDTPDDRSSNSLTESVSGDSADNSRTGAQSNASQHAQ
jgi:hypothetical protein